MAEFRAWLVAAWTRVRAFLTPSTLAWRAGAFGLLALWALLVLALLVNDIVPEYSNEKLLGFVVITVVFALICAGLLLVVWLLKSLPMFYRFALFFVLPVLALFSLAVWETGMLLAVPLVVLGFSLFFGAGASLVRTRSWQTGLYFALGVLLLGFGSYALLASPPDLNPALDGYHLKGETLALPDPGKPGSYGVFAFSYGSGKDRYRPEYADEVRLRTRPVDGSKLDVRWSGFGGWLRTRYWGFDARHMPLNGRVWMPEGAGPFPLVLIVHGNHQMEQFSDPGYAYLGELFASQGFILVSVDENFLNSTLADEADIIHPRIGDENKARAWLLLEHLVQWRRWAADPHSPLFGRVDMDRIVLIGHSRGGEAVATANAFNTLGAFPDDATLKFDFHFHLRGIAAIAPADGQYKPREWPTPMRDQNYFVIHGSLDGDVTSFMGSAQYSRAAFSGRSDAFKASVYVKGANHGQFNTSWGRNDLGLPVRFLLDERPIMDAQQQRRIAKVYLAAFLQATLHDRDEYRPLFADARNGAGWLPDIYLVNNYADSTTQWLANYEEDIDPASTTMSGARIAGTNLSVWREDYASLKYGKLGSEIALVAWDDRVHKKGAAYCFRFGRPPVLPIDTALVFSASQADISTLPDDFKGPHGDGDAKAKALDWSVVVADYRGHEARLPLSHDQVLYPQIQGETRRAALFDKIPKSELVMRRYAFVLADFAKANPDIDLTRIKEIRFEFDKSRRGAIALDDVGFTHPIMGEPPPSP